LLSDFSSFFELEYYLNEFEEAGKELVEIKLFSTVTLFRDSDKFRYIIYDKTFNIFI
jgi:hypothetical protein